MTNRGAAVVLVALVLVACGGDDGGDAAATTTSGAAPTTTTTAPADPFVVLVSNDDGVGADGIDAVVRALDERDDIDEVVVVAPLEDQSGSGDDTTEGAVASEAETRSGHPAVAVAGKPADAVNHALDVVLAADPPDLVVTGINEGQNLGPIVGISGTVGAARIAARRGIPAVAVSQGLAPEGSEPDYEAGVEALLAWLDEHLGELEGGTVDSINVPTCVAGEVRGTVEVPLATNTDSGNPVQVGVDCTASATDPVDDIAGFNAGYVTVSDPGL